MFGLFGTKKSRLLREDETSEFLNDAMSEYVATFPVAENLRSFLARHGRDANFDDLKATLDAAIKTTEEILWAEPGGVSWSEDFKVRLYQAVNGRHPWLSQRGFKSLASFAGWLCWHEGLNA